MSLPSDYFTFCNMLLGSKCVFMCKGQQLRKYNTDKQRFRFLKPASSTASWRENVAAGPEHLLCPRYMPSHNAAVSFTEHLICVWVRGAKGNKKKKKPNSNGNKVAVNYYCLYFLSSFMENIIGFLSAMEQLPEGN